MDTLGIMGLVCLRSLIIDDLFTLSGKNPRDYFSYSQHDSSCQYFFPSGRRFTMPFDKTKIKAVIEDVYSERDAEEYLNYLSRSRNVWEGLGEFFLSRPQFTAKDLLKGEMIKRYPYFLTKPMRQTLHQYNSKKLSNPELVQIADRYSTYVGSNPYRMGGIYSLIGHVEQNIGTFFPKGGMRQIPEAIHKLSMELGTEYMLNNNELRVETKSGGYTVQTSDGAYICDRLICGIDHLQFYESIFPHPKLYEKYNRQERSSTALVFYWAVKKEFKDLDLHNIFFSGNYESEFEDLFVNKCISNDPTIYVHISSLADEALTPKGCQNWFVMLNAPAKVFWSEEEINTHRENILNKLKKNGVDVKEYIEHESHWSAQDIQDRTGGYNGALYGAASNSIMAAMHRHPNKLKEFKNMYFCGGTAHPGGGIPQTIKSAEIVAQHILDEA